MTTILVIEDDSDVVLTMGQLFERSGYEFVSASDGRSGLRVMHEVRPNLIILDIVLPGMDGWTVLDRVRDITDLPVMVLTSHGRTSDKVRGLRAGADDYLTKPFVKSELLARVEALLRRSRKNAPATEAWEDVYDDGTIRVDFKARIVSVDRREVELTNIEFRLITVFVKNAGAVLSQRQLLVKVWSDPAAVGPERVKFAVLRLRRRLGWSGKGSPIKAIRGFGYRYTPGR